MSMSANRGFVDKMKSSNRRMVVFYGSQTGTAEEFAGRLAKEGARYGCKGVVADPEESEMEQICNVRELSDELEGETAAVFMMATYGEGDPTDNAQEFFDWLKDGGVDLKGLNFAVFGLGNKTYEHYNAMAIYVDKRLEELGGKRMHELGLGDDDANLEDDFITWKEKFWTSAMEDFKLEKLSPGEPARLNSLKTQRPPFDVKNPYMAPIKVNRNLHTASADRRCMHIEIDISGSRIRYDTAAPAAIYPQNDTELE